MNRMNQGSRRALAALLTLSLLAAACSRGDDESTSTTAVATTSVGETTPTSTADTTAESSVTTVGPEDTVATTTAVIVGIPTYEVVGTAGEEGELLVVVLEPGDYSNVQLENLVFDVVDRFAPARALVVDSDEAADLALLPELTDAEEMALAQATVISIENGVEVTFLGPYGDIPGLTIGS